MAQVGIRELLESGVHFGHQTRRWNPKMRRFIHGERGGIYIIDLLKTETLLEQAQSFAAGIARRGGTVLFVGTKKQARDAVKEVAEAGGMPYVNHRWLGGLLTNFQTISLRIKRLHDLERFEAEGQLQLLPTRERLAALADLEKLRANLGGVKNMQRVPDAVFVIDLKTEAIAVREAQRLRIPIIGLVDTNCDPDGIDYVVPGNDDAMRSCRLIASAIGGVVADSNRQFRAEEEQARREAEEQARREAEEQAQREAEELARKEEAERAARDLEATLTHGGEGEPRDVAEQVVADAATAQGRPMAEGRRSAEAGAAVQAADEPPIPAGSSTGPSSREMRVNPNAGERVPQEAGAAQGAGSPASDTVRDGAGAGEAAPRTRKAGARTRPGASAAAPAAEPGPSETAQAAMDEAPPAEAAEAAEAAEVGEEAGETAKPKARAKGRAKKAAAEEPASAPAAEATAEEPAGAPAAEAAPEDASAAAPAAEAEPEDASAAAPADADAAPATGDADAAPATGDAATATATDATEEGDQK